MPFKSLAQMRLIAMKEDKGELPKGTFARWKSETKNIHKLPDRKKRK